MALARARRYIRRLHATLERLEPETRLCACGQFPALERFSDQPDLLSQAWNTESAVLMDQAVYEVVLDLTDAPRVVRREVWEPVLARSPRRTCCESQRS